MSRKMPLPDELLAAVSAGYLYLGGEKVLSHEITEESFTVTTDSGTYRMEGSPEHYQGKPGAFEKDKAVFDAAASSSSSDIRLHPHLFRKI